jgi:pteridine reductase|tara:strand:- start:10198 stop:10950 length:753 start_codon:yes stop_codon:yes gene_type:complete
VNRDKTQDVRVALVTGAARRIGAAIAERLHQAGFNVVIHCHDSTQEADALAIKLNLLRANSACVLVADLSLKNQALALIKQAIDWQGRLDVLVNNASCFIKTSVGDVDEVVCDKLWITNVKAPLWLSEASYASLAKHQGSIINITDIHAEKPLSEYAVYSQTKAALKMQTEALAREYAPNIRVNAVAPGAIAWPEGENALSPDMQANIISKTLLKKHGEPKWIAEAVLSLVLNEFITGQTLRVDGGRSLN